jgi:dimethylaniline monooxygenase (N-oxide forming)
MPDGATFDQTQTLNFVLFYNFFDKWFPALLSFAFNFLLRYMSKKVFTYQPKSWKLHPAPSILITPPLVGDEIYDLMKRGFAEPVDGIAEVTGPKSVRLVDGRILEDIDSIVYCTGYDAETPFLPPEFNAYPRIGDVGNLYRNVWLLHPDPKVRNSLAFIGQVGIPISGLAQFELHAMAVAQVWAGKTPLPSFAEMKAWHRRHLKYRESMYNKQKHKSVFYTAFVRFSDHLEWMNWAAGTGIFEHFSWFNWRSWAFWLRDRKLYYKVKSGLLTPAIWRLFDMGKRKPWDGARAQIYKDNEFAEMRRKLKREQLAKESREVNGHKKGR